MLGCIREVMLLTAQSLALTLEDIQGLFQTFVPLGVVVRLRSVVAEDVTLRLYGQQLLKCFCSWDGYYYYYYFYYYYYYCYWLLLSLLLVVLLLSLSLEHTLSSYLGQ